MKISNINLAGDAVLAPIAGFTDVGFRDIAVRYGATLTYTEMISCKGMVYGSEKTKELLATTDNEKVKAVQIFGNDPQIMAKACCLMEMQKFDIIDINMGCPVPKIVNNGEGSALLNNPKLASEIVRNIKAATGTKGLTKEEILKKKRVDRYHDSEAKILENITSRIKDTPNVKGKIDLYTERDCCDSCKNLISEFRNKFPNIELNIYTDNF